ncbi:MAG: hypothetical protein JWM87_1718 [Candidatus Eremiobacteraeota bacterium]|nr:hypothetical protein [Candidatus Eremiobacteraeota bacterium]
MHLSLTAASVLVPLAYAVLFVLLLAPGYAVARAIVRRYAFDRAATLVIAYAVVAVAGYATFWAYFLRPELGRFLSAIWFGAALAAVVRVWRARISREEAVPLGLTFLAGLFYLAVLYLPGTAITAAQRFFAVRPQDNIVPQLFAEHLHWGASLRGFLGDWLTSDRPPLQSAMLLLVRPLFAYLPIDLNAAYELCGIIAQLVWLPAIWLLCVRAGFSPRQRAFVLAFTIFSGFFLYNTVYTWPKLLAAGLCIAALLFAVTSSLANRGASLVLAGVCAALALLAHGSAAFFLLPAFALAVAYRRVPFGRAPAWGAVAAVALLLPWSAYQRFYDPPGDRLIKMHLAGIANADPRPAAVAIGQAYAHAPFGDVARNKLANLQAVLGTAPLLGSAIEGEPPTAVNLLRVIEREEIPFALGALFLGLPALQWWWLFGRGGLDAERRNAGALLAIALASTVFWCLAMWGPGTTVTTHSAYAVEAILFVALAAAVAGLRLPFALAFFGLAVADLVVTWIVGSLGDAWRVSPSLDPLMILIALAAAAATGLLLARDGSAVEAR